MGAGDVKLMAALGAWLGWQPVIQVALYGAVAGGVLAIVLAMWRGYLRTPCRTSGALVRLLVSGRHQAVAGADARSRHGPAPALRASNHGGSGGDVMATLKRMPPAALGTRGRAHRDGDRHPAPPAAGVRHRRFRVPVPALRRADECRGRGRAGRDACPATRRRMRQPGSRRTSPIPCRLVWSQPPSPSGSPCRVRAEPPGLAVQVTVTHVYTLQYVAPIIEAGRRHHGWDRHTHGALDHAEPSRHLVTEMS